MTADRPMGREARRRELNREARAMDLAPEPPPPGEPAPFAADCKRSRMLLERFRAFRDEVIRQRKGGLS